MEQIQSKTELLQIANHRTLGDYLTVVPVTIHESGITSRSRQFEDRPDIGLVVSVGDKVEAIKEGDVVFFAKYSNDSVTYDGVQYILIRQEDVYQVADTTN